MYRQGGSSSLSDPAEQSGWGLPQTLAQGRNKAWLPFAILLGMALFLIAIGVYFVVDAKLAFQYLSGIVILAIAARILWRLRVVWRSI